MDIYNNETLHAHLDLVFVNIILPYIDINRKYILPNLSIDDRDFYLYLTSVFYGIFVLLIYFVYLLLKIRFINDFLKTYLSDNKEVQDMLNQSFCNYNFTDKFS